MSKRKKTIPEKRKTKENDFVFPTRAEVRNIVNKHFANEESNELYEEFCEGNYWYAGPRIFDMASTAFLLPKRLKSKMWKKVFIDELAYALKHDKQITNVEIFKKRIYFTLSHILISMKSKFKRA